MTHSTVKFVTSLSVFAATLALPAIALAGPSGSSYQAAERWDVITPRATVQAPRVSHVDIQPGSGFDRASTVRRAPVVVSRSSIRGSVQASERWDAVPAPRATQTPRVSHIDIQPGTSFDMAPRRLSPNTRTVRSAASAYRTRSGA